MQTEGAVVVQHDSPISSLQSPPHDDTSVSSNHLHEDEMKPTDAHLFDHGKAIDDMLEFYAELGDVQTCTVLVNVLRDVHAVNMIKARHWTLSYIGM